MKKYVVCILLFSMTTSPAWADYCMDDFSKKFLDWNYYEWFTKTYPEKTQKIAEHCEAKAVEAQTGLTKCNDMRSELNSNLGGITDEDISKGRFVTASKKAQKEISKNTKKVGACANDLAKKVNKDFIVNGTDKLVVGKESLHYKQ